MPALTIDDAASAQALAQRIMGQIVALPALAANAQANSSAEGVLNVLG